MRADPTPTHTGWCLFCPIYLADLDDDGPVIWARHWSLEPALAVALWLQQQAIALLSLLDPAYEPAWMFWGVRERQP